jgi:sigma-B regulation protein RsbU (phosphoserine phosphatase)
LFYAGYFIYKSSKNISKLTKGVDFFSSGKLDYRINVKGKDELSQLAKNFNQMAESINNYILKLKEKAEEEKEIELASKIQKSLLPDEKSFSSFKEANLYFVPSKGIGGDYFDLFFLKNNKILLLVGDASGHGISASLTMAMAKAIITSLIYRNTPSSCILQEVHSILTKTGLEGQYITLQIVEIDKNEKTMNFFSAGHPPAFFISKGKILELRINSFPIGVFDGPGFDMLSFKYEDGDSLLLYTDGLLEVEGRDFGIDYLKGLIEKIKKEDENFFSKFLESLGEIIDTKNFIDDVTVIYIKI